MEENELTTMLRDADRIDRLPPVDSMVTEGIRRGRHRLRTRRLTAVGVLGTSVAALATVVALSAPTIGPGVTLAPAAQPTSKPAPSEPSKPESKDKGTLPSVAELSKIVKANVPDDLTVRDVRPTDVRNNHDIVFELGDDDGFAWAGAGIHRSEWFGDLGPCKASQGCTESKVAGGKLRITRDLEKVGDGTWYSFTRSDGTVVWFGQRNAFEGNGPVTRERLPLTDKQVTKLVSDPAWAELTDRLPEKQPVDPKQQHDEKEKEKAKAGDPEPSSKAER